MQQRKARKTEPRSTQVSTAGFRNTTPTGSIPEAPELGYNGQNVGPHGCYSVMQSCWKSEPEDRPQFSELVSTISDILESIAGYIELSMPLQENKSYSLATKS